MEIVQEGSKNSISNKDAFFKLKSGQVLIEMMEKFLNIQDGNFPSLKEELEKVENVLEMYSNRLVAILDRQNILLFENK